MKGTPTNKPLISVIVPVFNEADGIKQLRLRLDQVQDVFEDFGSVEFIFVDDGSTDATRRLLGENFGESKQCTIVCHRQNRGVGAAFRTGFVHAKGDIVCTIDADCSYEPEGLRRLVEAMGRQQADIAVASPYHPDGMVSDVPAWRLFLSRVCSGIYRLIAPVPLYTYTSIFRAYNSQVIKTTQFEGDGFVSAAELLIHAAEQGYTIVEVPMVLHGRKIGLTKMKVARTIGRHISLMGSIVWQRLVKVEAKYGGEPVASNTSARIAAEQTYSYPSERES